MIAPDDTVGALRRDDRMTASEVCAVVTDPWWQTLPRDYRLAWWRRRDLLEQAHASGYGTVEARLAAEVEEAQARAAGESSYVQPPAEVGTRDPRPDDAPADPSGIVRLKAAAHESWEVRVGYCRGFRKVGRGNVRPGSDARWELTHFVVLEARPCGVDSLRWVRVVYRASAVGPLKWVHDGSSVPGRWRATAKEAKEILSAVAAPVP